MAGGKAWEWGMGWYWEGFAGLYLEIEISLSVLNIKPFLLLCYKYSRSSTSHFHSTLLYYHVDETPQEHRPCLFQLAYGKICFSYILFSLKSLNLSRKLSENLLYFLPEFITFWRPSLPQILKILFYILLLNV